MIICASCGAELVEEYLNFTCKCGISFCFEIVERLDGVTLARPEVGLAAGAVPPVVLRFSGEFAA